MCTCTSWCFRFGIDRHVIAVFPASTYDSIDTEALSALIWIGLSAPRKLSRIAQVISETTIRHINRAEEQMASAGVQIFDDVLAACRSDLGLMLNSYFRMIDRLLRSRSHRLLLIGGNSFSKIMELDDSLAYQSRVGLFIERFAAMCWHNGEYEKRVRSVGLNGLRMVFFYSKQHQAWDQERLDVVAFAFLNNLQIHESDTQDDAGNRENILSARDTDEPIDTDLVLNGNPLRIAQECLSELATKASFSNIRMVVQSVFRFFEVNERWEDTTFLSRCMEIIIKAADTHFGHAVISEISALLDNSTAFSAHTRMGVTRALIIVSELFVSQKNLDSSNDKITRRPSGPNTGISIFETCHVLLRALVASSEMHEPDEEKEKRFRELVIKSCKSSIVHLPSQQKNDILSITAKKFEAAKLPLVKKTLLEFGLIVTSSYEEIEFLKEVLSAELFQMVLELCADEDNAVRKLAHRFLTSLLQKCSMDQPQTKTETITYILGWGHRISWYLFEGVQLIMMTYISDIELCAKEMQTLCRLFHVLCTRFEVSVATLFLRVLLALESDALNLDRANQNANISTITSTFIAVVLKQFATTMDGDELLSYLNEKIGQSPDIVHLSEIMTGVPSFYDEMIIVRYGTCNTDAQGATKFLFPMDKMAPLLIDTLEAADNAHDAFTLAYKHSSRAPQRKMTSTETSRKREKPQTLRSYANVGGGPTLDYLAIKQSLEASEQRHMNESHFNKVMDQLYSSNTQSLENEFHELIGFENVDSDPAIQPYIVNEVWQ
eukprot:m.69008 g.69008  ORF g.69008 m.69008 type:complete len:777 (+) comp12021_c0_seq2:250-2580(+)